MAATNQINFENRIFWHIHLVFLKFTSELGLHDMSISKIRLNAIFPQPLLMTDIVTYRCLVAGPKNV